jgi:cytochrome c oxidase cbb3-type subunit III
MQARLSLPAFFALALITSFAAAARPARSVAPQHPPLTSPTPRTTAPAAPAPASELPQPQSQPQPGGTEAEDAPILPYASPSHVLEAPVSALLPGNTQGRPVIRNPVEGDPEAIQRGMGYFDMFNCSGCHAPNAGGGMGPSLSNRFFIYGGAPQNIYLSIYQGRPNGMPSWGAMLPENIIWDLVAYIRSISSEPSTTWGRTFSHEAFTIEQVPAEFAKTATPWSETQRFSFGQKPNEKR